MALERRGGNAVLQRLNGVRDLRRRRTVILRFDGGPMDGLEEQYEAGEPPFMLLRTPPIDEMVHAHETADSWEEPPDFGGIYMLVGVAAGVATYATRE
jgi:hypothetical protein